MRLRFLLNMHIFRNEISFCLIKFNSLPENLLQKKINIRYNRNRHNRCGSSRKPVPDII